jgi:gamma-glutamyl:cysteine ligase YbdK (ATP-grasp superfamily)
LFERFGVELEYMIARRRTLEVAPIADRLLAPEGGEPESELEVGEVAWSNELVLHVLEMKTRAGPARSLDGLADKFLAGVREANSRLAAEDAFLLPGGLHPIMDPTCDAQLWPHEYGPVYSAFDRIFDCRGHGWSNLQSAHLNLPFRGDAEFARLHAAIRFLLPLMPALAASSPVVDGRITPWLDARMAFYRNNARRVPSVSGLVVPEPILGEQEYRERILNRIYADLSELDPDGILRHEWVNARGAIARFERGAIEIRVLDVQECPIADLAIIAAITRVVQALCNEQTASIESLNTFPTEKLAALLEATVVAADGAHVADGEYLRLLGFETAQPLAADDVWLRLLRRFPLQGADAVRWSAALDVILKEGCLARRIRRRLGGAPDLVAIRAVWNELADCLSVGRQLREIEVGEPMRIREH